jgi:membrane fusion protein (multidrug efflux system)
VRPVESGTMLGDDVVILAGLSPGERVAASGSFKLREAALVAVAGDAGAGGAK